MNTKRNGRDFLKKSGLFVIAALLVAGTWVSWRYRDELRVPLMNLSKALNVVHPRDQVRCYVDSTIDGKHYLRMKLAIPCIDRKQRLFLTRNLPRFKNQLVMEMSQPEMKKAAKNRDFETLRYHVIKILNSISKRPITNVYFEGFLYG
jgi:flagellar basal body-associated protein FliL